MKRIKQTIYNNKMPIFSFLTTCIFMMLFYISNNVVPFGSKSILDIDCFHQYAPMLDQLIQRITSGRTLIYASNMGLGATFIGNVYNYLFSPFNLIALILGANNIHTSIALIIMAKVSVASFTFSYCLKKIYNSEKFLISFSLMYSFSAFFIANYINIMWLDAFYMLPLVVLGIYKIVNPSSFFFIPSFNNSFIIKLKEKTTPCKNYLPYTFALAYTIITNYYMGFIMCVASCFFFMFFYFSEYSIKDKLQKYNLPLIDDNVADFKNEKSRFFCCLKAFVIASIFAGLLSAFVVIPSYFILKNSSATGNTFPSSLTLSFNPLQFVSQHLPLTIYSFRSKGTSVMPNIYCGIISFLLVPLFFLSKNETKRMRIMTGISLIFFYLSFSINILNFIWHGLHFPNDFPYRFSYIYSFFLTFISYKSIINLKAENRKKILIVTGILLPLIIVLCLFFAPNKGPFTLVFSLILITLYGLLLFIYSKNKGKISSAIISVLIVFEMIMPYFVSMNTHSVSMYNKYRKDIAESKEIISENDKEYYRFETLKHNNLMDCVINNYNSVTSFSSMNYNSVAKLQKYLGLNANGLNTQTYFLQNPIYNAMFGINYILDNRDSENKRIVILDSKFFNSLGKTSENCMLYETSYKTGIGFAVNSDLSKTWEYSTYSPFTNVSNFVKSSTGINKSMVSINTFNFTSKNMDVVYEKEDNPNHEFKISDTRTDKSKESSVIITTSIKEKGHYYAFVRGTKLNVEYSSENFDKISQYGTQGYLYAVDLGIMENGSDFTTKVSLSDLSPKCDMFNFFVYRIDTAKTDKFYETIKDNGILRVAEDKDTYIKAEINSKTEFVYTSIPYDKNWTIKIDGKEIAKDDLKIVGGALIGIKTSVGTHTIEFIYHQNGLVLGYIISIATLLSIFSLLCIQRRRKDVVF